MGQCWRRWHCSRLGHLTIPNFSFNESTLAHFNRAELLPCSLSLLELNSLIPSLLATLARYANRSKPYRVIVTLPRSRYATRCQIRFGLPSGKIELVVQISLYGEGGWRLKKAARRASPIMDSSMASTSHTVGYPDRWSRCFAY